MHSELFCLSYKSFVLNNVIVTSFDVWQSSKLLCNCCALIYRGTENIYLYLSIFLPPKFWANCLKTTHYLIFLLSKQNSQAWFKKKIVLIKSRCQFFLPTLWKKSIHLGCMYVNEHSTSLLPQKSVLCVPNSVSLMALWENWRECMKKIESENGIML